MTTPAADGSPGRPSSLLSSAIKVGNRLYVSGMLGSTPETKGDMEAQTREALTRLVRTLEAGGYSAADVVDAVVYITDVSQFAAMNKAYQAVFPSAPPARANRSSFSHAARDSVSTPGSTTTRQRRGPCSSTSPRMSASRRV